MSELSTTFFPKARQSELGKAIQFVTAAARSETFLGESFGGATDGQLIERSPDITTLSWEDRVIGNRVLSLVDLKTEEREDLEITADGYRRGISSSAPLTAESEAKLNETIPAQATRDAIKKQVEAARNSYGDGNLDRLCVYENGQGDHAIVAVHSLKVGGGNYGPSKWEGRTSYQFFDAQGQKITEADFKDPQEQPLMAA